MISAGDFRNGITIEYDNNVYQIIEFQHVKPGKGAAFVRTKLKNIKSGGVVEKTFRPTEKCPQSRIEFRDRRRCAEVRKRERDVQDLLSQWQRILRGASSVCRTGDH